jgi:hypothetical protein
MNLEEAGARECTPIIYVETRKPPFTTLLRYASCVSLNEVASDPALEPLIANLASAKGATISGEHLYDLADADALIRLNSYVNNVAGLPMRVWLE